MVKYLAKRYNNLCQKFNGGKQSESKLNKERMPQMDSFTLFICGSIAGQPAVYNGCKNEKV